MNRFQYFLLLRRHNKLSERRSPMLDQSTVAKVMMVIGGCLMALYLLILGTAFGMMANDADEPAILLVVLPIFLIIDFFFRFIAQQTPVMLVKPYMLLPMPRRTVVESFLVTSTFSGYNLLWLCMFVPYCYLVWMGCSTLCEALAILAIGMLLVMANSQWYLLVRTLIGRSLLWWLMPAAIYGLYIVTVFLGDDNDIVSDFMDGFVEAAASWWMVLLSLALLAGLFFLNRWMQFRYVFEELAREQKKPAAMKHVSQFTFLERFGQTGEYLKLELKSIMRNKAIRSRVMMSLGLIVLLSGLIAYTNMYDGVAMLNFWCYYCFGIYGMTTLVKVMSPEGNYIDLLMTHRENILLLLKAKYYFHVAILVVPLLIMLPAVFAGKFSMMMMMAYMLITSGLLYFVLFQLAVYNKQTLPLDSKLTGKNNMESGLQLVIELVGMFVPMILVAVVLLAFEEDTAYLILALVGLVFTLLHPLWLRGIYSRLMRRKYVNLEGFHASR
ncbi:MAG: DUF5687 family protein [Prevotella sp.]|nr:DUF5687 family protein [Prevotella sp.]